MKNYLRMILMSALIALVSSSAAQAQSSGGTFTIEQSVIASGGGKSDDAVNVFSLTATIGQSAAGTNSTNAPFTVRGGFWTVNGGGLVNVGGRVLTTDGNGLRYARVNLTDMNNNTRTAITDKDGAYRFDLQSGENYIFGVSLRFYTFAPQVVFISESLANLNFTPSDSRYPPQF